VKSLGTAGKPFAENLSGLLTSLRDTGGLERLLDFIFLGTASTNGYDSLGHFLRSEAVGGACLTYAVATAAACTNAKLFNTNGSGEAASAARAGSRRTAVAAGTGVLMARTLAVLKGATPAQAIARYPGPTTGSASPPRGSHPAQGSTTARPVGGASGGTTYYSPSAEGADTSGMLLNYLLGN